MGMHCYLYIGKGSCKNIYKIGRTTQTCYQRCKNANYTIIGAIDLTLNAHKNITLNKLERQMIKEFQKKYKIAYGNEYFRIPKRDHYKIVKFWQDIVMEIIKENVTHIEERYGEVGPYTY